MRSCRWGVCVVPQPHPTSTVVLDGNGIICKQGRLVWLPVLKDLWEVLRAGLAELSLCPPSFPLSPLLLLATPTSPALAHGTALQDAATTTRHWALLQRGEAAEGAIRSRDGEREKPDGKAEISPAEPRLQQGPWAALASCEPGEGMLELGRRVMEPGRKVMEAALEDAAGSAALTPRAPAKHHQEPCGVGVPAFPPACCGSRWWWQQGGSGAWMAPADALPTSRSRSPQPCTSPAVATGVGGAGTRPLRELGWLLPLPADG